MTDSDATGGEAERLLNPIACGHCRQRKRKSLENNPENVQSSLKPPSQRKADRIREWDTLPLKSMDDIKAWFQSKSEPGNFMAAPLRVAQTELNLSIQRTVATPEFSESVTDPQSSGRTTSPLQDMGSESLLDATWEGSSDTTVSKAKSLEQRHPNIYF
ncbi:hypothetical protein Neosp_011756 [[Neocosmospora] mangrovei]